MSCRVGWEELASRDGWTAGTVEQQGAGRSCKPQGGAGETVNGTRGGTVHCSA